MAKFMMKAILLPAFASMLAFVSLYGQTNKPTVSTSADADYCIDVSDYNPRAVLVKKNNELKPVLLDIPKSLKCDDYYYDTYVDFKFIEESGEEYFTSSQDLKGGGSSYSLLLRTVTVLDGDSIRCRRLPPVRIVNDYRKPGELSQTIQAIYPVKSGPITYMESESKKEDILKFKNKIIDAIINIDIKCKPVLDTTLEFNFRAKITGECAPDFLRGIQDTVKGGAGNDKNK